jgi:hypothetical protein
MRTGCLNLVLVLVATSLATTLIVIGLFLLLSFAALSFESPTGIEALLKVAAALLAGYFFFRVGQSVWRDLRGQRRTVGSGETNPQKRGSSER